MQLFSQLSTSQLCIQLIIVLSTILIVIGTSPIMMLLSSVAMLCCYTLIIYSCGLSIFSAVLLLAEMHVFYIILCVHISIENQESAQCDAVTASKLNKLIKLSMICLVITLVATCFDCWTSVYAADSYIYSILLATLEQTVCIVNTAELLIIKVLAISYLSINAAEFLILNVFMFIVVIVLFEIHRVSNNLIFLSGLEDDTNIIRALGVKKTIIRQQSQTAQLNRSASSHIISGIDYFDDDAVEQ